MANLLTCSFLYNLLGDFESEARMQKQCIPGGSPFESTVGYSRAVRVGPLLLVSGTTASSEGGPLVAVAGAQAREALRIIARVLEAQGSCLADVVRTRMFVVDIAANAAGVGRAHGEVFGEIRPAASMLGVAALIDPLMLVEIEADAVVLLADDDAAAPAAAPGRIV